MGQQIITFAVVAGRAKSELIALPDHSGEFLCYVHDFDLADSYRSLLDKLFEQYPLDIKRVFKLMDPMGFDVFDGFRNATNHFEIHYRVWKILDIEIYWIEECPPLNLDDLLRLDKTVPKIYAEPFDLFGVATHLLTIKTLGLCFASMRRCPGSRLVIVAATVGPTLDDDHPD